MPTLWLVGVNKFNPSLRDWRLRRMIIDKLAGAAVWRPDSAGAKRVDWLGPSGRNKILAEDAVVYFTDETTSFMKSEKEFFDRDVAGLTKHEPFDADRDGIDETNRAISEVWMHKLFNLKSGVVNDDLTFATVAAQFAAAAIHEAMHNKVDEGQFRAGNTFDLHTQGGRGVAVPKLKDAIDGSNNLIVTAENQNQLRTFFATRVHQFIRTDFFA